MKPESLKHLQQMHALSSDNQYFRELIEAIIRIESETTTKSKFKIWDYVTKDSIRPAMCCVFHDGGFKVATDSHILIALEEGYDPDMEGKLLKKDGTIETERTKYPKWRDVIPNPELTEMVSVKLDFAKIRDFEKDFKAKMKAAVWKGLDGYVKVNGNCWFKLGLLMKAVKFMEHVGTDVLMVHPDGRRAALAVGGQSKCIVMPIMSVAVDDSNKDRIYTL